MIIRVGNMENEFRALKELIRKLPERTQDKIAEVAQPMIEQSQELQKDLENKKIILVKRHFRIWPFKKR